MLFTFEMEDCRYVLPARDRGLGQIPARVSSWNTAAGEARLCHYEKESGRRSIAKMLTKDEAQIAVLKLSFVLQLRFVLNPIITACPAD